MKLHQRQPQLQKNSADADPCMLQFKLHSHTRTHNLWSFNKPLCAVSVRAHTETHIRRLQAALVHIRGSLLTFDHWSHQVAHAARQSQEYETAKEKWHQFSKIKTNQNWPIPFDFIFTVQRKRCKSNECDSQFPSNPSTLKWFSLSFSFIYLRFLFVAFLWPSVNVCVISRIEFKPISIVSPVRGSIVVVSAAAVAVEMQNRL